MRFSLILGEWPFNWPVFYCRKFGFANLWTHGLTFQPDLGVPDVPKAMEWCKDSLCVGFKRDYYLIKVYILSHNILSFYTNGTW